MARKKGPAADQAYEIILSRILSFELLPGDVVSDHALALNLDMSRTPHPGSDGSAWCTRA